MKHINSEHHPQLNNNSTLLNKINYKNLNSIKNEKIHISINRFKYRHIIHRL